MAFITPMGIVSLFSDMTHEGARSILGEYLNITGASAATIGFVSGIGELCGYSLRLLSGFVADKAKRYWSLVIIGYAMQVLTIPALALIPENGWVAVSEIIPRSMRSTGSGIFETGFGIAWFLGSWLLGALYDISPPVWLVAVSVAVRCWLSSAMPCASASGRRIADCRAQKSSLCRRSSSTYEKALSDIPVP